MGRRTQVKKYQFSGRLSPLPPAVVTNLQRLNARMFEASCRLTRANQELHRAEVAYQGASEAIDAELARLAGDVAEKHG